MTVPFGRVTEHYSVCCRLWKWMSSALRSSNATALWSPYSKAVLAMSSNFRQSFTLSYNQTGDTINVAWCGCVWVFLLNVCEKKTEVGAAPREKLVIGLPKTTNL